MKEYKVISMEEGWLSDRFDNVKLENLLNSYARDGWIVKTVFTDERPGLINISRKYCVFVLERERVEGFRTIPVTVPSRENTIEESKDKIELEIGRKLEHSSSNGIWVCDLCGSENDMSMETCEVCGKNKE